MSRTAGEYYANALKESKGQAPPNFDDTSRGVLLALIKERPTIWNSTAKLTKDDVLASFQQCSGVLSNMDPSFHIWSIIEKWCWVVESYVRCSLTQPPSEWRYNNTLEYLKPFASSNYPYLGCLSKKRRNELTQLYADPEITIMMDLTEDFEFPAGIFREEMHILSGDEQSFQSDIDAMALARTVGQVVNVKRRGRPSKADKRSPVDQFINLTPQSAQFQKLLENNGATVFTAVSFLEPETADDHGFTPSMYTALIEMIQDKPEIWHTDSSNKANVQQRDQILEDIAKQMFSQFKFTVDISLLGNITGSLVRKVWERLRDRFKKEEKLETPSKWKYFQQLQFLSSMPAYLENGYIKSEDPSTSSGFSTRVTVASPAGSSQSEDSRMATSSPASTTQFANVSNGNKSIKTVLDNLVARSKKEELNINGINIFQAPEFSEIQKLLDAKPPKLDIENGPPLKRVKQEGGSPTGSSKVILYNNDMRQTAQAPISTWVPPREDLSAKGKEDTISNPPQKRAQATAVIKSGIPLDKQLKKMLQQTPVLIPATIAGPLPQRNNLMGLTPLTIQQSSALQQALLKRDPPTTIATMPSVSTPHIHQAQTLMNGSMNGNNTEQEDKWTHLGKLIATSAREVEARDPMSGLELQRDLQNILYQYSVKSLERK